MRRNLYLYFFMIGFLVNSVLSRIFGYQPTDDIHFPVSALLLVIILAITEIYAEKEA